MHRFNIYSTTKSSNEFCCPCFFHRNCRHQLVFSSFDLKVVYLPVWHYMQVKTDYFRRTIDGLNWELFLTIVISNENIFFSQKVKYTVYLPEKTTIYFCVILSIIYKKNLNDTDTINNASKKFVVGISEKLNNPSTTSKFYWSFSKTLHTMAKKYHVFLHFFITIGTYIILKKKSESFNFFFKVVFSYLWWYWSSVTANILNWKPVMFLSVCKRWYFKIITVWIQINPMVIQDQH